MMQKASPKSPIALRDMALQGLLLLALLTVLFPAVFAGGETLLPGDLLYKYQPWAQNPPEDFTPPVNDTPIEAFLLFNMYHAATDHALEQGEWPLWNPLEFCGMPLLANYQSGVLYPPRLLHRIMDRHWATTVMMLLRWWLCGMTAFLCARVMGLGLNAARFASIGWMLSGYNMIWGYWLEPDIGIWFPVLLIAVELLLNRRYRGGFCAMAFAGTMLLLVGHPESALTVSMGTGLYFFLRLALERRWGADLWRPLGYASGAWAVTLAVTAPQTLPFVEYLFHSHTYLNRPEGGVAMQTMAPQAAVALWVPRFFGANADGNFWFDGAENSNYVLTVFAGVGVWLLIPVAFMRARSTGRTTRFVCLAIPTALTFLVAFDAPGFRRINTLPVLDTLWPVWYLGFGMFTLPLLAAFALEPSRNKTSVLKTLAPVMAIVLIAGVVIALSLWINGPFIETEGVGEYVAVQCIFALGIALLYLIIIPLGAETEMRRVVPLGLVIILAAELLFAGRGFHMTSPREALFPDTELTAHLRAQHSNDRINATSARIPTGLLQEYGIEQQMGYDGIMPERMFTFLGSMGGNLWDSMEPVLATRFYLHNDRDFHTFPVDKPDRFELTEEWPGRLKLFMNKEALPRAFLVPRAKVEPDKDALFTQMRDPAFDPTTTALLEWAPDVPLPSGEGAVGDARLVERTSNRVVIDVSAKSDAALVLSDAWYPGWMAYIDGIPVEVVPVFYAFRSVIVPEGEHRVEFRYEPATFRYGLILSVVALLASLLLSFHWLWTKQTTNRRP
jgi:hypothetical protein